jgi:hypothetical protein
MQCQRVACHYATGGPEQRESECTEDRGIRKAVGLVIAGSTDWKSNRKKSLSA